MPQSSMSSRLSRNTFAFVLAGGRGSRLRELTDRRAKPAVYFGGKTRIIDFALSNALNSGIRRIGVATQYKAHSLIRHLQRGWNFFRPERNESFDILPASQRVDAFTLCALADLLLDLDRPAEALALVEDEPGHDGKLLRGALAARRLDAPWWREQVRILGERFAAATQRGDALHLREEARYRLALADDAAGALRLATANWRAQREFWDARLVLESALAAGELRAAG